jgi:5-methylcytosine-specific restriction endonuclease McrA
MPEFTAGEYRAVIDETIRALIQRGKAAGEQVLQSIAFERIVAERRVDVPRSLRVMVFRRDHFTCRYCGTELIPEAILRLLAHVYPTQFPHDINWKAGLTHRAIPILSAEVDHILPIARGGLPLELENLRTACPPCNTRKWDLTIAEVGMKDLPISASGWDGLTSLYGGEAGQWQPRPHGHRLGRVRHWACIQGP